MNNAKHSAKFVYVIVTIVALLFSAMIFFFAGRPSEISKNLPAGYDESNDIVSFYNLDINSVVHNNNTIECKETFEVKFNTTGLSEVVRYMPYIGYTYYQTEAGKVEKTRYVARVLDVKGNGTQGEKLNIYTDEEAGYITIGFKNKSGYYKLNETRQFSLSYVYDMGKDNNKGFDSIYYNIVGRDTGLTIRNINYKITLPSDLSSIKNLQMYSGRSDKSVAESFTQNNNVITGHKDVLQPYEAITLRIVYSDGYLTTAKYFNASQVITLLVAVAVLVIGLYCFFNYKQRAKLIIPIEPTIPEGLTPLKAEYFYKSNCTTKGIVASIVELAKRGYLKIKELDNKEIELIKLSELKPDEDKWLADLYNTLFKGEKTSVNLKNLGNKYAMACNTIISASRMEGEEALYNTEIKSKKNTFNIVASILTIVMFAIIIFNIKFYFGFFASTFIVQFIILGVWLCVLIGFCCVNRNNFVIANLAVSAIIIAMLCCVYFTSGFNQIDSYYIMFVSTLITVIGLNFKSGESKYSKDGALKKGRVLGLKNFIEKCDVQRIKVCAESNPTIFFDVLPYAYIFDLSNVWIKKISEIVENAPEWVTCENDSIVDMILFHSIIRNFQTKAREKGIVVNRSSFSSGGSSFGGHGGFGGGGFSGGGSGGGGFGAR